MNSDGAVGKSIPKAVLVTVVHPLDDIGGQAGRVDDFFNTTSMKIGQTLLQLLGDNVEKLRGRKGGGGCEDLFQDWWAGERSWGKRRRDGTSKKRVRKLRAN